MNTTEIIVSITATIILTSGTYFLRPLIVKHISEWDSMKNIAEKVVYSLILCLIIFCVLLLIIGTILYFTL